MISFPISYFHEHIKFTTNGFIVGVKGGDIYKLNYSTFFSTYSLLYDLSSSYLVNCVANNDANLNRMYFQYRDFPYTGVNAFMRSTDGGANWSNLSTNSFRAMGLQFTSTSIGYAWTKTLSSLTYYYTIYQTGTEGASWNSGTNIFVDSADGIFSVDMFSDTSGSCTVVLSDSSSVGIRTFMTTDSWTSQSTNNYVITGLSTIDSPIVKYVTSSIGYAFLKANGKVYKTTNGGVSWSSIYSNGTVQIYRFLVKSSTEVFIFDEQGNVKRTVDSGSNWTQFSKVMINADIPFMFSIDNVLIFMELSHRVAMVDRYGYATYYHYPGYPPDNFGLEYDTTLQYNTSTEPLKHIKTT